MGLRFRRSMEGTPRMKKVGLLAVIIAIILFIINRLHNEVTVEVDTDE